MTSVKSPDKGGAVEFSLKPGAINYIENPDWKTKDQLDKERWRAEYDKAYDAQINAAMNPKDLVGQKKPPLSCIPALVLMEISLAMMEGARKHGRHNYRAAPVLASIYYDGAMRHLMSWFDGQDIDPDSGLSHITKAIASLVVLRDAMINEMWVDDRPPKVPQIDAWIERFNRAATDIVERYPDPKPVVTEKEREHQ